MNQTPHEPESKIQTPLMLKYKFRDYYDGTEIGINTDNGKWIGYWDSYDEAYWEIWRLVSSDGRNFLPRQYFKRYEYYAAGDPNPAAVYFTNYLGESISGNTIRTYCLSDDHVFYYDDIYWNKVFNLKIRSILQEYERQRDGWQTRVVIGKGTE